MKISAVALLGLVATCAGSAQNSGFPSVSFAPRGGAAAKQAAKAAALASANAAAASAKQSANPETSTAPLSQAAELTPKDEPLLRDISMLSDMLEEVVKKDDPEADALYRKFRSLGLDR